MKYIIFWMLYMMALDNAGKELFSGEGIGALAILLFLGIVIDLQIWLFKK